MEYANENKVAIIDVGSNSVRYVLLKDGVALYRRICTTRLGAGLLRTGKLSDDAVQKSVDAIKGFVLLAKNDGAMALHCFATAAVRSAENREDFLKRVKDECGIGIDVISGRTEAKIGLLGAVGKKDGVMIDVGGASTEVCLKRGDKIAYSESIAIGAVKLLDECGDASAEESYRLAEAAVEKYLGKYKAMDYRGEAVYAVGGTATAVAAAYQKLAVYEPAKIHGFCLTYAELQGFTAEILPLTPKERTKRYFVEERRAETIGVGALLLCGIMQKFGFERIVVSESDNVEGYYQIKYGERE